MRLKYSSEMEDTYIWRTSDTGIYSTKSGYKLAKCILRISYLNTTQLTPLEKGLWSKIWKVKMISKIRHFMWKALSGALAVADCLQTRGIYTDLTCVFCGFEHETICHVPFNCSAASQVWSLSGIPFPRMDFSQSSIFLNLHYLVTCGRNRNIPEHIREAIPWILWHI